jgi:hypothetical protein
MSANLVELAQRFVRLSGELDSTRDAMKRLLLNGAAGKPDAPFARARRPGAKRPQSSRPKKVATAEIEQAIVKLLQSSPGMGTAAIARATATEQGGERRPDGRGDRRSA